MVSFDLGSLNSSLEIGHAKFFSDDEMALDALPQEDHMFDAEPVEYDPYCTWEDWEKDVIRFDPTRRFGDFFVYASCHWPEHFGAVKTGSFSDLSSIETLCQSGSTRLRNWTEQYCRPDCAIKPRFEFEYQLYDPLSITSLYGSEEALCHLLDHSHFDNGNFFEGSAMKAVHQILQYGELARLRILMTNSRIGHQLKNLVFFRLVIEKRSDPAIRRDASWATRFSDDPGCVHAPDDWQSVFSLVELLLETMVQEHWANDLLCIAAGAGCEPVVGQLIVSAQDNAGLMAELLHGRCAQLGQSSHQSVGRAILGNHVKMVEYLLGMPPFEAHLRHVSSQGQNVFHAAASRHCNPAIFRLLISRFPAGMYQQDNDGRTPLDLVMMSVYDGRPGVTKILLSESDIRGDECSP